MAGYSKLFSSIVTSSIWCEDNITLRVWIAIDFARGTQTRADWLREAIKTALYYDAIEKAKLAS